MFILKNSPKEVNIILDRGTLLRVEYDSIHYSLVIVYSSNNDDVEFLKKAFLKNPLAVITMTSWFYLVTGTPS